MDIISVETRAPSPRPPDRRPAARRVAAATMVGSVIEWYDFYVYGTSVVLVLGPHFFPAADPLTSTLLAFSTFGVGFLARPVGAVVLSHLGDRRGRKPALVVSLLLMGGATVAVGLLPTYAQAGLAAPVLLVVLRLVQGFAVGGEWGGASLLAVEHAPPGRRMRYGSMPQYGTPIGLLASSGAILLASLLPHHAFLSWGWRLPFLASAALVVVGLWIRLRVDDAEEFRSLRHAGAVARRPVADVLRWHWRAVVIGTAATFVCHAAYIVTSFLPSYATVEMGRSDGDALVALMCASVVAIGVLSAVGRRADGARHHLAIAGSVLSALWIFPAFWLAAHVGPTGLVAGVTIGLGVLMLQYAVLPALLAEQFPTALRYTGVSLCFQLSAVVGGGLLPLLASAMVGRTGHYAPAAILLVLAGAVSAVGVLLCRPGLFRWGAVSPASG